MPSVETTELWQLVVDPKDRRDKALWKKELRKIVTEIESLGGKVIFRCPEGRAIDFELPTDAAFTLDSTIFTIYEADDDDDDDNDDAENESAVDGTPSNGDSPGGS